MSIVTRNGNVTALMPQGEPSKKVRAGALITVVIGIATTALGSIAVVAFFISPHTHALIWLDLGPYSFVLLGGGVLVTTISSVILYRLNKQESLFQDSIPMAMKASWDRLITYETDQDKEACNLDVAFADPVTGLGIVLDGLGHNNAVRGPKIAGAFDQLCLAYRPITKASSIEGARASIFGQIKPFLSIDENNQLSGAALSFCQIVQIGGVKHLLLFQWADTRVLIQKENGTLEWLDEFYTDDIEQQGIGYGYKFGAFELEKGSTIIGFSDGIGEYLSKDVFEEALYERSNLPLLERLVEKVKTNDLSKHPAQPISGKEMKSYQEKKGDDVALFCLTIQ